MKEQLKCVVCGSFKFKPEIDRRIEELEDLGVIVLAPEKGWLAMPVSRLLSLAEQQFRPLPSERGMSPVQVENGFLEELCRSDFVYIQVEEGYVGRMVCLEIGAAMVRGVPIFASERIEIEEMKTDLWFRQIIESIEVKTVAEAIEEVNKLRQENV